MSQPLVFVGLVNAVTPVQNPPVTWQKKDAGDPTDILRNSAEFHSCINLMIHCFATPRWYKSIPLGRFSRGKHSSARRNALRVTDTR